MVFHSANFIPRNPLCKEYILPYPIISSKRKEPPRSATLKGGEGGKGADSSENLTVCIHCLVPVERRVGVGFVDEVVDEADPFRYKGAGDESFHRLR